MKNLAIKNKFLQLSFSNLNSTTKGLHHGFLILLILIEVISIYSCKGNIPRNYRIYIAPIVNKTNWTQIDTELLEYLHFYFNKISTIEKQKELSDIQIHILINSIQIFTHSSGTLDIPLMSDVILYASVRFVGKKTNYNLELYEEASYIPGQKETIDYALQRLYEKIATRMYFEITRIIENDKKV